MKALLIFPPQWLNTAMLPGLPSLAGTLKEHGHITRILDLNIDFYNHILNRSILENSLKKATNIANEFNNNPNDAETINKTLHQQRIEGINRLLSQKEKLYQQLIPLVDETIDVFRNEKKFYELKNIKRSSFVIDELLEIASLPYYPFVMKTNDYKNILRQTKENEYKLFATDKSSNMFIEYFERKADEILSFEPDYIGISINAESQMIPGLTLARILKKKTKAHISIGGGFVTRRTEYIKNDNELFDKFIDSATYGDGEKAIIELADFIDGKIDREKVSNIIYKNEKNEIKSNPISLYPIKDVYKWDYKGYDPKKYFIPEGIMLIRASRGCYWNKCIFCYQNAGTVYGQKTVDEIINEIKEIIEKYGVNKFFFTDATLSPAFLDEFTRKILEQKIKIFYMSEMKFEKLYTKELLKRMYDSGMRICYWGLESGSDRVLKYIRKGSDINTAKRILKDSHNVGMYNFAYFILGIPTETKEEMQKTVNFLCKNKKYIDSYLFHPYILIKDSPFALNPEEFGFTKKEIEIDGYYDYCPPALQKVSKEEIDRAHMKVYNTFCKSEFEKFFLHGRNDILLLYASKYNVHKLKQKYGIKFKLDEFMKNLH